MYLKLHRAIGIVKEKVIVSLVFTLKASQLTLSLEIARVSACLFEILHTIIRIFPSNKIYRKVSICVNDSNALNSRMNSLKS